MKADQSPSTLLFFLPIGVGIAIGLNAGRYWAMWGGAWALAFAASHIVFRSWHFRQYAAAAGASASILPYFAMRLVVEVLKVGVPIAFVFAVRGPPFRIGAATPWPASARVEYVATCSADLVSQGQSAAAATTTCSCIGNALEAEFGMEGYDAMAKAQPRKRGTGVEQRLHHALTSCPIDVK